MNIQFLVIRYIMGNFDHWRSLLHFDQMDLVRGLLMVVLGGNLWLSILMYLKKKT